MSLDLQLLGKTIFNRLLLDAEGAAVRNALGAGSGSVLNAEDLTAPDLPDRPLVAMRRFPAPTVDRVDRLPQYRWYIYDNPDEYYWRIDQIATLIIKVYDPVAGASLLALPSGKGVIGNIQTDVGPQFPDPALGGLLASWVAIFILSA